MLPVQEVQKNGHGAEVQTLVLGSSGHISVRSPEAKVFRSHHRTHCMENTENYVLLHYYEPKQVEDKQRSSRIKRQVGDEPYQETT